MQLVRISLSLSLSLSLACYFCLYERRPETDWNACSKITNKPTNIATVFELKFKVIQKTFWIYRIRPLFPWQAFTNSAVLHSTWRNSMHSVVIVSNYWCLSDKHLKDRNNKNGHQVSNITLRYDLWLRTSYYSYARPAQPGLNRTRLCGSCIAAKMSWWLGPLWSDSVIKLVSVLFGKCTTFEATKCWPMETRLPRGDQWKAEKIGVFGRRPITRCFIKSDRAGLFIEHRINFRLYGEHWRAVQYMLLTYWLIGLLSA